MGYIVAIGGGDNGWGISKYETENADEAIVELSGRKKPHFLFIGFAAKAPEDYYRIICDIFGKYNCRFTHLDIEACRRGHAKEMIHSADIIYVGGGNTYKLMRNIRKYKLDILLTGVYYNSNTVLCGVSAGAICWCRYGNSATRYNNEGVCTPIRVKGLGLLNVLYCPHCSRDFFRSETTKEMLRKTPQLIGLEMDYSAIVISEARFFRIVTLNEKSVAKKVYWYRGKYYTQELLNWKNTPIEELYKFDEKEENR